MDDIQRPGRADRVALYVTIGVALVVIVLAVIAAAQRLEEVAPGHDIPVVVPIDGESATLPIGPGGAAYPAAVETATVVVADPAPATLFALWAEPIFEAASTAAIAVVGAIFLFRVARGRVFERGALALFYVAVGILAAWYVIGSILTNMTTNGALAAISDYSYDSIIFTVGYGPALGFLALGGIGAALEIGTRMRKETEGLV